MRHLTGILLFVRKNTEDLSRPEDGSVTKKGKFPIIVVLENVRSMHNVGSVFRTCDALSAEALYLVGYTPVPPHRDIQKTALGATETVAWKHFGTIGAALTGLQEGGYTLIAAEQVHGSRALHQYKWNGSDKLAIVFGNEVTGVSDAMLQKADLCLEIPQFGEKHSFNISVSAGIVLWEMIRNILL